MITWQDLIQFCMFLIALISLIHQIENKKKQPPLLSPKRGYFFVTIRGRPSAGSTLRIVIISNGFFFVN